MTTNLPLAVDLDGTIVHSDCFWISWKKYISWRLWRITQTIYIWQIKGGRSALKRYLAARIDIDPASLSYINETLEYLKEQHKNGREMILVSGSDDKYVQEIAKYIGLFKSAHGSDGITNLTGKNKAAFLNQKYGTKQYVYAGNCAVDLHVWQHSAGAIVVSKSDKLVDQAKGLCEIEKIIVDI